jgi:hypothetical protein
MHMPVRHLLWEGAFTPPSPEPNEIDELSPKPAVREENQE